MPDTPYNTESFVKKLVPEEVLESSAVMASTLYACNVNASETDPKKKKANCFRNWLAQLNNLPEEEDPNYGEATKQIKKCTGCFIDQFPSGHTILKKYLTGAQERT